MFVKAANLSHTYDGKITVLNDISFELNSGCSLAVTGPSGCGKSTLMNCLALLTRPTSGQILLDDVDVTTLSESKRVRMRLREIGLIRQDLALLPHRSALENVIVPLLLKGGMPRREMLDRGRESLIAVGLEKQADSQIGCLSGGQRQRAAIARAVVSNPKLILADEPTAQLDAANARKITDLLLQLTAGRSTLVFATHDISLLASFDQRLQLR